MNWERLRKLFNKWGSLKPLYWKIRGAVLKDERDIAEFHREAVDVLLKFAQRRIKEGAKPVFIAWEQLPFGWLPTPLWHRQVYIGIYAVFYWRRFANLKRRIKADPERLRRLWEEFGNPTRWIAMQHRG